MAEPVRLSKPSAFISASISGVRSLDPSKKRKGSLAATLPLYLSLTTRLPGLQGGFDFKTPSFEQGLGNVLGILVPARPLPQPRGAQVLVGGELILVHNLLEFSDCGSNRPNRFGLAPVGVSTSLCHEKYTLLYVE